MTLWYTMVLSCVILVFSFFIYGDMSRSLDHDLNKLLRSKAEDIAQVISSYNQEDLTEDAGVELNKTIPNADFINAAKYAVEKNTSENIFIQIFRQDNTEVVHSGNMTFPMTLARKTSVNVEKEPGFLTITQVKLSTNDILPLKTFTIPVVEKNKFPYLIQVTTSLKHLQKELNSLKTALFIFFPFTIFVIAALGQFLTKMALSPVVNMTTAINQITSKNLKEKIILPDANDEIKKLAETFNDMLTRMDVAFSSQQQLVQDISHELRTPLTALKGNQEVTLSKERKPEEYEKVLKLNLEEINRMSKLVENLLLLARLENKPTVVQKPVKLKMIIEQVMNNMKVLADRKNISLSFESKDNNAMVADPENTVRIFSNIVDNAIKYTPVEGHIKISSLRTDMYVKVSISDDGVGIDKEELAHVFDRFYRVDKSRSDSGFGLGLSIAKSIADMQKGKIEVESTKGKGTTFIVSLSLRQV